MPEVGWEAEQAPDSAAHGDGGDLLATAHGRRKLGAPNVALPLRGLEICRGQEVMDRWNEHGWSPVQTEHPDRLYA